MKSLWDDEKSPNCYGTCKYVYKETECWYVQGTIIRGKLVLKHCYLPLSKKVATLKYHKCFCKLVYVACLWHLYVGIQLDLKLSISKPVWM